MRIELNLSISTHCYFPQKEAVLKGSRTFQNAIGELIQNDIRSPHFLEKMNEKGIFGLAQRTFVW